MLKVFTSCFQNCLTPMNIISCLNGRISAASIPIAMIIIAFVRMVLLKTIQRPLVMWKSNPLFMPKTTPKLAKTCSNYVCLKKTGSEVYSAKHMFQIMAVGKSTIIEAYLKYTKLLILRHEYPVSFEPSERGCSNNDRIG